MKGSELYKKAGVDTDAGQKFVGLIKESVKSTHDNRVLENYGGFSGAFDASFLKDYQNPVLLSATDGVGTKLKLASLFDRHDTIGIDLVAMCSNDILVSGGIPLIFLDYIACGKLNPEKMQTIVSGISEGCKRAGASLMGGETAEHPDTMEPDDYDLAGFMTGVVEKTRILDGSRIKPGDRILSIPSTGVHSNGLSLIRKIYLKNGVDLPEDVTTREFLKNEILLAPTAIYEKALRGMIFEDSIIRGLVHITGGGFYENIPRVLPEHLSCRISRKDLKIPELFRKIALDGKVDETEMFSVFNMGSGMIMICPPDKTDEALEKLNQELKKLPDIFPADACIIGEITEKNKDRITFF